MRSSFGLILLVLGLLGCSREHSSTPPEPEALADAADSARITIWEPELARDDTLHHSAFYDSVLAYVRQSVEIERMKRYYGQSIAALTPLTSEHVQSGRYRQLAIDSLSRFAVHDSDWHASFDMLLTRYRSFVLRTLDTLYRDSLRYERVLPDIVRRDLFYPRWRPEYDSVESAVIAHTLDVLRLVDTNARQIRFEDDLRFSDYDAASAYDSLRALLDSLGREEQRIGRAAR